MEEQNYNSQNQPINPSQNPQNNQNRNLIIAAISVLVLAIASYFIFFNKKDKAVTDITVKTDSLKVKEIPKDSVKVDSAKTVDNDEYEGEDYEPITESFIISNEAFLRSAPNADDGTKVKSLKFGERVYLENKEPTNGYAKVYLSNPGSVKNPTAQAYYLTESVVVSHYQFDEYKKYFSLAPFSGLASKTKKLILDEDYSNGTDYEVTQNADRAKNTLSYGDFDQDGSMDIAIVLDNNEKQTSRLLIICTNKATKEPYLGFAENYSDKVRINSFKKGASVFMNSDEFTNSPNDGIIVNGEDIKLAIIYQNSSQKFKTYYQE